MLKNPRHVVTNCIFRRYVVTLKNYMAGGKMYVCGLRLSNLVALLLLWPDLLYISYFYLLQAITHSILTNL